MKNIGDPRIRKCLWNHRDLSGIMDKGDCDVCHRKLFRMMISYSRFSSFEVAHALYIASTPSVRQVIGFDLRQDAVRQSPLRFYDLSCPASRSCFRGHPKEKEKFSIADQSITAICPLLPNSQSASLSFLFLVSSNGRFIYSRGDPTHLRNSVIVRVRTESFDQQLFLQYYE